MTSAPVSDPTPALSRLIDGHAHLHAIESVEKAVSNGLEAGVRRIVAVGMSPDDNRANLAFADRFPDVVLPAAGLHPWNIRLETLEQDMEDLTSFFSAHAHRLIAVGEVGLDYKVKVKKPLQKKAFSHALELAARFDRPVITHSRFSHRRTFEMTAAAGVEKAVFHWYSGPLDVLSRILDAGYRVSATPALAHSPAHQRAMAAAPLERILIETDCPVTFQGKASDPGFLSQTLTALSWVKDIPVPVLAQQVVRNAENFFSL